MIKADESDSVWSSLRSEVVRMADSETMLASYLHAAVLNHQSLEDALSYLLAGKLASPYLSAMSLREVMDEAFSASADIREALRRDLVAVANRDPAARGVAEPFLHYKGFHALEAYRVSHWLWLEGRQPLAALDIDGSREYYVDDLVDFRVLEWLEQLPNLMNRGGVV